MEKSRTRSRDKTMTKLKGIMDLTKPLTKEEAYYYYKKKEEELKQKETVLKTDKGATKDEKRQK